MKFVRVGDDAFEVTVNLDTLARIGTLEGDERDNVIGKSFKTASERFAETDEDEVTEAPETE